GGAGRGGPAPPGGLAELPAESEQRARERPAADRPLGARARAGPQSAIGRHEPVRLAALAARRSRARDPVVGALRRGSHDLDAGGVGCRRRRSVEDGDHPVPFPRPPLPPPPHPPPPPALCPPPT